MPEKIRWGILGTGNIAHKFAGGLTVVDDAELVAVGSRTQEAADKFGDEFGAARAVTPATKRWRTIPMWTPIYVSTPHPFHKDNTILCLKAGKAVICEKPFAINEREAQEVIDAGDGEGRVRDGSDVDALHPRDGQAPRTARSGRDRRGAHDQRRFWLPHRAESARAAV